MLVIELTNIFYFLSARTKKRSKFHIIFCTMALKGLTDTHTHTHIPLTDDVAVRGVYWGITYQGK